MGFVIIGGTDFASRGPGGSFFTLLCPKNVTNTLKSHLPCYRYTCRDGYMKNEMRKPINVHTEQCTMAP